MKKIIRQENGRTRVITVNEEKTMTQQHHADAHNINNIMKKYQKIGVNYNRLPDIQKGMYGDFSKMRTYQESVQAAIDVQTHFMTLPSSVRKRFSNDPQELFNFLNDKNNRDEAIKLGLIDAPPPKIDPPKTDPS